MLQEMRIRNYSERTIKTYCSLLRHFFEYTRREPSAISTDDLKNYLYYRLKNDNISISTINQTISAWRMVYVHLLGKEWEGPPKTWQETSGCVVTAGSTLAGQFSGELKAQGHTSFDVFHGNKKAGTLIAQSIRCRFQPHGGQYQAREGEKRPTGHIAS